MMQVASLATRIKQAEKDAALYNSREALFGKPITDYSEGKKLWETFEPYQQFWSIAAAWKVGSCILCQCTCFACASAWLFCFQYLMQLRLSVWVQQRFAWANIQSGHPALFLSHQNNQNPPGLSKHVTGYFHGSARLELFTWFGNHAAS